MSSWLMDSHPDLIEGQEQPGEEWFEVKDGVGVWMGEGIGTKLGNKRHIPLLLLLPQIDSKWA